jgi:hypothetical protein
MLMATVIADVALALAEKVPFRLCRVDVSSPATPETVVPLVVMLVARVPARDSAWLRTSEMIASELGWRVSP